MQHIENYDHDYEPVLDHAERVKIMLTAFRRAPSITALEARELRRRYLAWREERLAPFVSVLADVVLRSMGLET